MGGIFMKKKNLAAAVSGVALTVLGIVLVYLTRSAAIAENAADSSKFPFALSLILVLLGIIMFTASLLPGRKPADVHTLALASMFAALCYIGFSFLRIDIPVGTEKTAFHLGNVFCVLAALFLGGLWGGAAGAVGMTIADLTTGYITSAPKTFLLKLCIGLIAGFVAHSLFHISEHRENRKVPVGVAVALSCTAGMAFNVVADPLTGYFYKTYILGIPQDAALIWAKMGAVTTLVNAVIAVVAATVLYLALRPALRHAGFLKNN